MDPVSKLCYKYNFNLRLCGISQNLLSRDSNSEVKLNFLWCRVISINPYYKKSGYMTDACMYCAITLRARFYVCKTGLSPPVTLCY